jgi:hypothetical protein
MINKKCLKIVTILKSFCYILITLTLSALLFNGCSSPSGLVPDSGALQADINLNCQPVTGSVNSFIFTWDQSKNLPWLSVRGNARGLGGTFFSDWLPITQNSIVLSFDVGTTFNVGIHSFTGDFSQKHFSDYIQIYIPRPLDYPLPLTLSNNTPTLNSGYYKFDLIWTKSNDPNFLKYEVWDISRARIGYNTASYINDVKIFETTNINTLSYNRWVQQSFWGQYNNLYLVYVVTTSGKRTPSNWLSVP